MSMAVRKKHGKSSSNAGAARCWWDLKGRSRRRAKCSRRLVSSKTKLFRQVLQEDSSLRELNRVLENLVSRFRCLRSSAAIDRPATGGSGATTSSEGAAWDLKIDLFFELFKRKRFQISFLEAQKARFML